MPQTAPDSSSRLRRRLQPSGSVVNTVARRSFIGAAVTAFIAFVLSGLSLFVPHDLQWGFALLFWLALLVALPSLIAVIVTGSPAPDVRRPSEE